MDRVIETLNISDIQEGSKGGFKNLDSEMLAHEIRMIMLKYYPQSNRLSEALYEFILLMLSAPNDEALLGIVDNIFSTVLEVEQVYIEALDEKERIFK